MEEFRIHKLWQGCADVPSTRAERCIKNNEDLLVKFGDDSMLLTAKDLSEKRKYVSKQTYGEEDGKPYKLWGYPWKPIKQEA